MGGKQSQACVRLQTEEKGQSGSRQRGRREAREEVAEAVMRGEGGRGGGMEGRPSTAHHSPGDCRELGLLGTGGGRKA